jgi:hypothetical protein
MCSEQLGDLRAMMSLAKEVDVPEPSPLFWDHLSSRVSAAVAMEEGSARLNGSRSFGEGARSLVDTSWSLVDVLLSLLGARAVQASVVLAASLLIVALINGRSSAPPVVDAPTVTIADAVADPLTVTADDDASLTLVASMTDGQDLDTVREAGLVARGSAEHAVTHLTDGELRELRRLLKEEIARPGA